MCAHYAGFAAPPWACSFSQAPRWTTLSLKLCPPGSCLLSKSEAPAVEAFKRRLCVKDGVLQLDWYKRLDDAAGRCTLPAALIRGTVASNNKLNHNFWTDLCAPLLCFALSKIFGAFPIFYKIQSLPYKSTFQALSRRRLPTTPWKKYLSPTSTH